MSPTARTEPRLDASIIDDWGRRYTDAWNALDAPAIAALCTEDIVWHDPALPHPARGRLAVEAFVTATARATPDFALQWLDGPFISDAAPVVLRRYRLTGTMLGDFDAPELGAVRVAATGARIDVSGVDEWTFSGGLLSNYDSYYDSLGMMRQMGGLPAAGSRVERTMSHVQHLQARFQRRAARRNS